MKINFQDEHGEEDLYLARGKPITLNKERYDQLKEIYVSARIEYDSHVVDTSTMEESDWY